MSYVTTHLDDESGIQYQGVQDKTDINQLGNLANMLMLVEDVPRGRLDGYMTITKANKTAMLGQEKGNLYLQAVDDALDQNVPSIQVLRVNSGNGVLKPISCVGAESSVNFVYAAKDGTVPNPKIKLMIDGIDVGDDPENTPTWIKREYLEGVEAPVVPPAGYSFAGFAVSLKNLSTDNHRIEIIIESGDVQVLMYNNSTIIQLGQSLNKHVGVCLGPKTEVEPPWDIEYVLNGQTYRALTGNPIPLDFVKKFQQQQIDNGESIFNWISGMTSLKINSTITDISDKAFYQCGQITNLELPPTLKTIGNSAFSDLKKLLQLDMPDSVTTIGTHAFLSLEAANSIKLSKSLTVVPQFAFDRAFKAAPVLVIPDSVITIEEYAFREWKLTTEIIIGSGIQEIKENAFYGIGDYSNTLAKITIKALVPPVIAAGTIPYNTCPIYVPSQSVNAYKTAVGWVDFADRIIPIP
ncbi:leucine-rich repeat domain-containing protein [Acinetobacter colistiniresistens]|uniref:leucine-rich repeat domain-containing protein n=1 Tax=Acinetobacter colistiniresistens TaxID=280145 RepID=UPI001250628B|nr:leucine-rich repeat domain-containing protein [Acinetobacter colistiniresistens]